MDILTPNSPERGAEVGGRMLTGQYDSSDVDGLITSTMMMNSDKTRTWDGCIRERKKQHTEKESGSNTAAADGHRKAHSAKGKRHR